MPEQIVPSVGMTGNFQLAAPFDQHVQEGETYTCHAIRRIGDFLSLNEDPKEIIYDAYGLTEEDYENDQKANMLIVSLQSESSNWLYVPARFILSFPILNGVSYRTMMLSVCLGALPDNMDLSPLQTLVSDVVYDNIGVRPEMTPVAVTPPVLISREEHDTIVEGRLTRATQKRSYYSMYRELQITHQLALNKIQELETYIKAKHIEPI
jgi:hypothetical protein